MSVEIIDYQIAHYVKQLANELDRSHLEVVNALVLGQVLKPNDALNVLELLDR